jgi:hypothetical protein
VLFYCAQRFTDARPESGSHLVERAQDVFFLSRTQKTWSPPTDAVST